MRVQKFRPQFTEFIPDKLEEGVLYISERYKTASHKCACGCGEEVVTPLSPVEWQIRRDGDLISLNPSIGNWNYACRSHYWIRRNLVQWAGSMSARKVAQVQEKDRMDKARYIEKINELKEGVTPPTKTEQSTAKQVQQFGLSKVFDAVIKWLTGR